MAAKPKQQSDQSSALRNGLAIVEYLAARGEAPASLTEIGHHLKLPNASALRLLRSLCEMGYADRDGESKRYRLTSRFQLLANHSQDQRSLNEAAAAPLTQLRDETEETSQLCCLFDGGSILLDERISNRPFKYTVALGSSTPWWICAPGKAMAAKVSEEELDTLFENRESNGTAKQLTRSRSELLAEILEIRERGWALDNEENIEGLKCVGMAVLNPSGRQIGGVTIAGFRNHFSEDRLPELVNAVERCVKSIERAL